jgi:hypothetical protein
MTLMVTPGMILGLVLTLVCLVALLVWATLAYLDSQWRRLWRKRSPPHQPSPSPTSASK